MYLCVQLLSIFFTICLFYISYLPNIIYIMPTYNFLVPVDKNACVMHMSCGR